MKMGELGFGTGGDGRTRRRIALLMPAEEGWVAVYRHEGRPNGYARIVAWAVLEHGPDVEGRSWQEVHGLECATDARRGLVACDEHANFVGYKHINEPDPEPADPTEAE